MTQAGQTVRNCDGCTLCCKLIGVGALDKPMNVWCQHCAPMGGCAIYESRPDECRIFNCGYLREPDLGPEWKPSECKIVLATDRGGKRIIAHVDPQRPDAWRREPFYSTLKQWARNGAPTGGEVIAAVGSRVFAILADRDVELAVKPKPIKPGKT